MAIPFLFPAQTLSSWQGSFIRYFLLFKEDCVFAADREIYSGSSGAPALLVGASTIWREHIKIKNPRNYPRAQKKRKRHPTFPFISFLSLIFGTLSSCYFLISVYSSQLKIQQLIGRLPARS
jgi:hypothetical protein